MTRHDFVFPDYANGEGFEVVVNRAPDLETALLGALEKVPARFDDPIIVITEYFH